MKQLVRTVKPNREAKRPVFSVEERELGSLARALIEHFRSGDTANQWAALRQLVDDDTLGPRHLRVLFALREEALSVGALATRLNVNLSTASQLTGELRRAGLLAAERSPTDARSVLLSIDPRVRRPVEAFFASRFDPLRRTLAGLEPKERAAFLKGLRLWLGALGVEPEGAPEP